jgi:hypothetical protein
MPLTRRQFLRAAATAAFAGEGGLAFLGRLPAVSAAEATLDPKVVRFNPEIEPLVRLLEDTTRDRLIEEMASRVRKGLPYRDLVAALLLAGIRNIQPRPVGFKFHAVLVVNSAHLASISSPDADRWLPIFWALDQFKSSQARDAEEGDWTMEAARESDVPAADRARAAFVEAMDNWDEAAADAAATGLARSATPQEAFEAFARFGARDFRDIGHKAIYVANGWRTLQHIGWQHAEPVLRSLAYALLNHSGGNPAKADDPADRHGRRNAALAPRIRADWLEGKPSDEATAAILNALRVGSSEEIAGKVVELLNAGAAPRSAWDALFAGACEILMRRPGIVSLHAVTMTNAMHFAFQTCVNDDTRRMLLLQNASFLPRFRGPAAAGGPRIDDLEPLAPARPGPDALEEAFADVSSDKPTAARKVLGWLEAHPQPQPFIDAARRLVFLKGNNSHDYKFSSAVLEDYGHVSPAWRNRFLAASVFSLRGSGDPDQPLAHRIRAALGS